MSSKMKKLSLSPRSEASKRKHEDEKKMSKKHAKCNDENPFNQNIFIKACEIVSTKFEEDMLNRFHLPSCLRNWVQGYPDSKEKKNQIQPHVEETFNIEMGANKWYEAIQISFLSITSTQYLSLNVLKNIVEIILNVHEDPLSEYHMTYLIAKCQQVLSLNLRMHPPHSLELREHYKQFLTSPMGSREKTLTDRKKYGSELGIFDYCINRLISELSGDIKDGPFFNKEDEIPENLTKIQEIHWMKSRLEIYEMLNRTDRIDRLMVVMDSLAELLGFDLAFFHSRKVSQHGYRRMKPLMMEFLEKRRSDHDITQKDQTHITSVKIIKIFVYFVHLNYPEKYIKTMSLWINILAESLSLLHLNKVHLIENFSESYNVDTEIVKFSKKIYNIIAELPRESVLKIFENITPAPVKYSIAVLYARELLGTNENEDIVRLLINIVKNCRWNDFPETTTENKPEERETQKCITSDNILKHLTMICKNHNKSCSTDEKVVYLKFESVDSNFVTDWNYVMRILYITFQAYLDNYKIHRLQETLLHLKNESNKNQLQESQDPTIKKYSRNAIIPFISMYRKIYNGLKEYFTLLKSLKSKNELPEVFYNFEKIIELSEL